MREVGFEAEKTAVKYLKNIGYKVIDTNFYTKFGEIDIIAFKDEVLHFIEVKYSKKYEAVYKIDSKKIAKMLKSANIYIQKNGLDVDFQFDAVIVSDKIELIENITF